MDNIFINGKESYDYGVGYMHGEVGIDYFNNESEYDDGYVHMRSFITIDVKELEKLNMTPQEFAELINKPEGKNVNIDVDFNGFPVGTQSLDQYICVEVRDDEGRLYAREENEELLDFIRKDINDQMQYDTIKTYQKDLSFKNVAVFITDEKRTPVNGYFEVRDENTDVTINYNSHQNRITVAMDTNNLNTNLVNYLTDTFGKDRLQYVAGDIMYLESSSQINNIDIEQFKQLLTKTNEVLEKGYTYDGPTVAVYGEAYGYVDGKLKISSASESFDYNCSEIAEVATFTESQVKQMGYTPQELATMINSQKGDWITFKITDMNGVIDEYYKEQDTFPLTNFAAVQIMTDDYKNCIVYQENEKLLGNMQRDVDDEINEIHNEYAFGLTSIDFYGYQDGKLTFGERKDFDNDCSTVVDRIVFTESQVRKMGYEPQEFVELINNTDNKIMIGVDHNPNTNLEYINGIHTLDTFDTVEVVSDDFSTSLAYAENIQNMEIATAMVDEMVEKFENKEQKDCVFGKVHQELYGYVNDGLTFGIQGFDYDCSVVVDKIVITESQVSSMGYEPQEFVAKINDVDDKMMVVVEYDERFPIFSENQLVEGTYPLYAFESVEVMSDDGLMSLAYAENEERMEDLTNIVDDMIAEAIEDRERTEETEL